MNSNLIDYLTKVFKLMKYCDQINFEHVYRIYNGKANDLT